MFLLLRNQQLEFLDAILKTLASNPVLNNENDVYEKVCFEKDNIIFNAVKIPHDKFKSFLPKGKELYYFRLANKHLEDNKLVYIDNSDSENIQYIITFEGLLLSKSGGIKFQKIKLFFKSFLQNVVWISTLIAFGYTSFSFLNNKNYCKDYNQSLTIIHKECEQQKVEIQRLKKELLQIQLIELKSENQ